MKKIRINVLARELEVKSHLILELLPDLGVSEKLTHSSSIDEDVADKLRVRFGLEPIGNGDEPSTAETDGERQGHEAEREEPPATADGPPRAKSTVRRQRSNPGRKRRRWWKWSGPSRPRRPNRPPPRLR